MGVGFEHALYCVCAKYISNECKMTNVEGVCQCDPTPFNLSSRLLRSSSFWELDPLSAFPGPDMLSATGWANLPLEDGSCNGDKMWSIGSWLAVRVILRNRDKATNGGV